MDALFLFVTGREEELQNAKLITCPIKRTRAFGDGFRTIIHKVRLE